MTTPSDVPDGREIGRVVGGAPGPTLIAVAGIHGNERAGVVAARRVLSTLTRRRSHLRGEFVALSGNLGAMQAGVRYRERDMNRVWNEERILDLEARARAGEMLAAEDAEQLELSRAIREASERARGQIFAIDLHTTSAQGVPFVLFGDTLSQRKFAQAFPLPIVIGLEEQLDGVLSAHLTTQGCITCAVEGGQHDDAGSVDNLEAVLLLGAESAGMLGEGILTETEAAHALLERRRGDLPRVMEVVSRHAITPDDEFVMEPGFANLARVDSGRLLARTKHGAIHALKDGMLILPLYQGQGADGFFWGRELSETRMRVSEVLRHMKVDRFLHLLPGIARDPVTPSRFVVEERQTLVYRLDLFHMLGYLRVRRDSGRVTIERQREMAS
ncbi:MAG TPA: succinylglutamate desuccinylase/aspartoacylase family protein [Labilithrix sp.]|nr:succinylglutamate desuccinylase/aspartoacylase family protein [Labilithrix sp.]